MEMLLVAIFQKIQKDPDDIRAYRDLLNICRETLKTDVPLAVKYLEKLSDWIEDILPGMTDVGKMREMFALHRDVVFAGARESFHLCLLAVEWNREPDKKFYPPRRMVLREVVRALQELEERKLDLLAVSMPPGSGKTTLAIFYLTWIAGRHPEEPTLTGSHSNSFVRGVYDECLRIFDQNGDYLWQEVFPETQVANTNAKDCRIDLGKRKRFETLQFTSIGTGNAGLYRAMHLLYCDDLVSGIEVALNKERLDKLWETYTTDLRQRKIGDHCGELHIATRWSVHDIIGRLETMYGNSPRAKFIVLPAMNANDESNFDYAYGVGFNTQFYRQQRDIMDDASWRALYMNEPIEREGLLYHEDELRRYFELPSGDPDAIISICDTKDKGTDYAFLPVAYVYGQDYYIEDCICDNGLPEIVDARLADILIRHKVKQSRFESNSAGGRVAEKVQQMVKDRGGITHITTKYTTANKETKIIVNSAWVKEHCLFKDETTYKRNSEYGKFISMLCSYTMMGKNKNDDTADGMAMLAEYAQSLGANKVEVFQRPW
jgi:predicted phage terminase large subunit-like protein